jgi:hypothetical protein
LLPAAVDQASQSHLTSQAVVELVGLFIKQHGALQFLVHLQLQSEPVAGLEPMVVIQFLTQSPELAAVMVELSLHFLPMVVLAVVQLGLLLTTQQEQEHKAILAVALVLEIQAALTQSGQGQVIILLPAVAVLERSVIMEVYQRKAEMVESV